MVHANASARYYAGGDAAAQRPYLRHDFLHHPPVDVG